MFALCAKCKPNGRASAALLNLDCIYDLTLPVKLRQPASSRSTGSEELRAALFWVPQRGFAASDTNVVSVCHRAGLPYCLLELSLIVPLDDTTETPSRHPLKHSLTFHQTLVHHQSPETPGFTTHSSPSHFLSQQVAAAEIRHLPAGRLPSATTHSIQGTDKNSSLS